MVCQRPSIRFILPRYPSHLEIRKFYLPLPSLTSLTESSTQELALLQGTYGRYLCVEGKVPKVGENISNHRLFTATILQQTTQSQPHTLPTSRPLAPPAPASTAYGFSNLI